MTVLVTGANGFVGRWVVRALLAAGHTVVGATGPGGSAGDMDEAERRQVVWVPMDLGDQDSVWGIAARNWDAVIHLAGYASAAQAMRDPGAAWLVNAAGTARVVGALGERRARGECDPLVVAVSSADVYAAQTRPLVESDAIGPRSPYGASKRGAELAAEETAYRTGLRVVTVRPFPHTGPGQDARFVAPAFARRLLLARREKLRVVNVGNLEVIRDLTDVRDVADAYVALLTRGVPGQIYNVASGTGIVLADLFHRLAGIVGVDAIPESDAAFLRAADLPYLVGDASKLRAATGWQPRIALDDTLRDLVHAQTD